MGVFFVCCCGVVELITRILPCTTKDAAVLVGKAIAEACLSKDIGMVSFDRGGFLYHGRVQVVLHWVFFVDVGARDVGVCKRCGCLPHTHRHWPRLLARLVCSFSSLFVKTQKPIQVVVVL